MSKICQLTKSLTFENFAYRDLQSEDCFYRRYNVHGSHPVKQLEQSKVRL